MPRCSASTALVTLAVAQVGGTEFHVGVTGRLGTRRFVLFGERGLVERRRPAWLPPAAGSRAPSPAATVKTPFWMPFSMHGLGFARQALRNRELRHFEVLRPRV